jgi:hypothetical protein
LLIVLLLGCSVAGNPDRRAEAVGAALCASIETAGEVPGLVRLGSGLRDRLASLRGELSDGCTAEIRSGDAPAPLGDGRGTHHILLRSGGREILGLRLAYDRSLAGFHVLGFWTPNQNESQN